MAEHGPTPPPKGNLTHYTVKFESVKRRYHDDPPVVWKWRIFDGTTELQQGFASSAKAAKRQATEQVQRLWEEEMRAKGVEPKGTWRRAEEDTTDAE